MFLFVCETSREQTRKENEAMGDPAQETGSMFIYFETFFKIHSCVNRCSLGNRLCQISTHGPRVAHESHHDDEKRSGERAWWLWSAIVARGIR